MTGEQRGRRYERDPDSGEWYRRSPFERAILVAGPEDGTAPNQSWMRECWACRTKTLHSTSYHEAMLSRYADRYFHRTEDENGVHLRWPRDD